jgi:lycopene cyclase domain-containing protein
MKWTYVVLDLATIAGPLFLSFDKKVAFYKKFKSIFPSIAIVSLLYIIWDIWFTSVGIWKFNPPFLFGTYFAQLPIEEYGFFLVVPYALLFIYECLKIYFPKYNFIPQLGYYIVMLLCVVALITFHDRLYTTVTFSLLLATLVLLRILYFRKSLKYSAHVFLTFLISLIPMGIVNGILTSKPVLIYNNLENSTIRIGTIPIEDFFYNFLYIIWVVCIYEWFAYKKTTK